MLAIPDPSKSFVAVTDASQVALGAVLSQEYPDGRHPVAFLSKKFFDAEQRYPTHERELLALVYALKSWRHYILGAPHSVAYTDHHSLRYMETQPKLTARQARWMELLQEFNVHIDYLPGRANVVADALSRNPLHLNKLVCIRNTSELEKRIKEAYEEDEESQKIMKNIQSGTPGSFKIKNGLILWNEENPRIYVPAGTALRQDLLEEHHDSVLAGHLGMDKTYSLISRSFYWPRMEDDVREFVRTCPTCCTTKSSNKKPIGLLQPLPIPSRNWLVVSMDLIVGLPPTPRGFNAIVTLVDKLSKMMHCVPTRNDINAVELARIYFDNVIRLHGIQEAIISDRGTHFTSIFWKSLFKLLGTKIKLSTAYHPQTDVQTERANRTIEEMLRAYVNDRQTNWDEILSAAEFAYNDSVNASTGKTPFFMNYGSNPVIQATLDLPEINNPASTTLATDIETAIKEAKQALEKAQQRQIFYEQKTSRSCVF